MKNDLISVIVPIYKVEAYLNKCVDSILAQTYSNLEIILVDDGSPDSCGAICDEYAKSDSRITVYHKENGGLSDARNYGIDRANGEYFIFVDSDDYIHPRMIDCLYEAACQSNSLIAVCDFKKVKVETDIQSMSDELVPDNIEILDIQQIKEYMFDEHKMVTFTVAWNKIYHKSLFDEVRYPFGKIHEDEFTTYKLLHKVAAMAYVHKELYYYVQRTGSITTGKFSHKALHKLDAYLERLNYYLGAKDYICFEKTLFLYKMELIIFQKKLKAYDILQSDELRKYYIAFRKVCVNGFLKGNKRNWLGYLYYYIAPRTYYKQRGN